MNKLKLHLGCGPVYYDGWVNIDLDSPFADEHLDLTKPFPYENHSVAYVFNEHFIEHVDREQGVAFLRECNRVLVDGGAIRISTPDLSFLIKCYLENRINEWGTLWGPSTKCQMMNEGMRSWGHKFLYDSQELISVLAEAGFNEISFKSYRESDDLILCGLESRPYHNELIVEAKKVDGVGLIVHGAPVVQSPSLLRRVIEAIKNL